MKENQVNILSSEPSYKLLSPGQNSNLLSWLGEGWGEGGGRRKIQAYLKDGSAETIVRATIRRRKLQITQSQYTDIDRLAGLVVKASASRAEDPGFESRLRRDFSGSGHTSDF